MHNLSLSLSPVQDSKVCIASCRMPNDLLHAMRGEGERGGGRVGTRRESGLACTACSMHDTNPLHARPEANN